MKEAKNTRPGYRIKDAAREARFFIGQGTDTNTAINFVCTLRNFGRNKRVAVARMLTKSA